MKKQSIFNVVQLDELKIYVCGSDIIWVVFKIKKHYKA